MQIEKLKNAFLLFVLVSVFLGFLGWIFMRALYWDELLEFQNNISRTYPLLYNSSMFVISSIFAVMCYRDLVKYKKEKGREIYRITLFVVSMFIFGYGLFVIMIKNA